MSVVRTFQAMRRIYGFCPCCEEPFRLSDAEIFVRARPPVTEFDRLNREKDRLERQIDSFEEREQEIREAARLLGQRAARRRLGAIAPFLKMQKIEPLDVKVLFHPVEYVVFHGLRNDRCTRVDFVDHPPESVQRESLLRSIDDALRAGAVEWKTFRVMDDGKVASER